ncbi:MAG TPA: hypothetical protein VE713_02685, partial [Pyrinomonadaceae bacterium]|nr:hypothetical protein [Pyrinomonadaceae bacterium]
MKNPSPPRLGFTRIAILVIAACLLLSARNFPPAHSQADDKFVVGVNYPWVAYGHDFGSNGWGHDGVITGG